MPAAVANANKGWRRRASAAKQRGAAMDRGGLARERGLATLLQSGVVVAQRRAGRRKGQKGLAAKGWRGPWPVSDESEGGKGGKAPGRKGSGPSGRAVEMLMAAPLGHKAAPPAITA